MEKRSLSDIHKDIDQLINSHEISKAKESLSKVDIRNMPELMRGRFAELARRCGELKLALKILQPNIFGVGDPRPDDLIEYASSVRRLGLVNQALILLERAPEGAKTFLNKAFCYINMWDYRNAQVELEHFLSLQELTQKQILVGKINLLSCYIENQEFEKALPFLDEFEGECEMHSPHLLLNCLETRGQILIKTGQPEKAIKVLNKALEKSRGQKDGTSLFIEKWLLIARCMKGELQMESSEILKFKASVREMENWEVIRDFDWQLAKIFDDQKLMKAVYFGTPYQGFRNIIHSEVDIQWNENWIHHGKAMENIEPQIFDFFDFDQVPVGYGKAVHRLMMLLASDNYQPFSVVRIFNSLFSDELFDPTTAPKKVYRCLEQLKDCIKKSDLPMELLSTAKGYRLRPKLGHRFKLHNKLVFNSREEFLSHVLYTHGLRDLFKVKDAQQIIPLSTRQWYRAFRSMQEKGVLGLSSQSQSYYSLKKVS